MEISTESMYCLLQYLQLLEASTFLPSSGALKLMLIHLIETDLLP